MSPKISPLAHVDSRAELASDVVVGPFCYIGPHVKIGTGTILENNVTIVGRTVIGSHNRFFPNCVVGTPPQDISWRDGAVTYVEIGNDNVFREGVTINCGAEKEDHTTRIGNKNLLMINSHVAHNCHIYDHVILVNGVLLGGHVHVHDGAIVSGNSVVHHFSTLGTLSFVSGGCRVPHDIPPYMLSAGSDHPEIKTINVVGLRRRGIPNETIGIIKRTHRLIFREHKRVEAARELLQQELGNFFPSELNTLLGFLEAQQNGKMGRAREAFRNARPTEKKTQHRRAA